MASDPIHDRLAWSLNLLEELRREVLEYVRRPPYSRELGRSEDGLLVRETATLTEDCPTDIPLLIGDIVHNLRATLDNLVGEVRPGGPTTTSGFPIRRDPTVFHATTKGRGQLAGVPAPVVDVIRGFQPFGPMDRRWTGEVLEALDELGKRERHRRLLVSATVVQANAVTHQMQTEGSSIVFYQEGPGRGAVEYSEGIGAVADFGAAVVFSEDHPGLDRQDVVGALDAMYQLVAYTVVPAIRAAAADQSSAEGSAPDPGAETSPDSA